MNPYNIIIFISSLFLIGILFNYFKTSNIKKPEDIDEYIEEEEDDMEDTNVFERKASFNFNAVIPISIKRTRYKPELNYFEDTVIQYKLKKNSHIKEVTFACDIDSHNLLVSEFNKFSLRNNNHEYCIGDSWYFKLKNTIDVNIGVIQKATENIMHIEVNNDVRIYDIKDLKMIEKIGN